MGEERNRARGLEGVAHALTSWRRRAGGPGRRIPAGLWAEAAEAARTNGITETARALRLDARKLAALATPTAARASKDILAPTAFMEFGGIEIGGRQESLQIELVGRDGDQVRVHVPSGARSAVDVVELARAFWNRYP